MGIPVKIAAASSLSAVPLVYGLRTAKELSAEITILNQEDILNAFTDGKVDVALLSSDCVRTLEGAKIITSFCIAPVKGAERAVTDEWNVSAEAPIAALLVAREGVEAEVVEAIEVALTLGVERIYEALLAQSECPKVEDYTYLTSQVDYLFDLTKHKALEAHWKKLKKATSHANPG